MKQLLLASKQQLQQQQASAQQPKNNQQSVAQLLQGIQSGQQVTTLVKSNQNQTSTVNVSTAAAGGSSVTIPVQMQNVQGIKTIRQNPQQPTMVQLRHQLVQGPRSKIIPGAQGGQTILATTGQGQKVSLSQVAGAKGLPAQLIVSGNSTKPVTVQQIHQIKANSGQQLIPHNILKAGQSGSTVQARVIPATVAGRQQIHVVAAPATASATASTGRSAAPNVTVDASGRPQTSGTPQIRVAAGGSQHQLLNQVLNVRPASVISQNSSGATTKLHVVQATPPTSSANQQNDQNNG